MWLLYILYIYTEFICVIFPQLGYWISLGFTHIDKNMGQTYLTWEKHQQNRFGRSTNKTGSVEAPTNGYILTVDSHVWNIADGCPAMK